MSWLLKQAEDILNRVDQQTNAAIQQHGGKSTSKQTNDESISEPSSSSLPKSTTTTTTRNSNSSNRFPTESRRNKKTEDSDLFDYLNNSTPANNKSNRSLPISNALSDTTRTASSPDMSANEQFNPTEQSASSTPRSQTPSAQIQDDDDEGLVLNIPTNQELPDTDLEVDSNQSSGLKNEVITSLQTEIQTLIRDKRQYELDFQTYKRQQMQYQHQIAESDALLRELRSLESDLRESLSAKDSQIALLRVRLSESDETIKNKTNQCEQLQGQCTRILQDHTDSSGIQSQAFDSVQLRLNQLEQDLQQRMQENERLIEEKHVFEKRSNDERQQLIEQLKSTEKRLNDERLQIHEQQQQTKQSKNLIHQLEQDANDYKAKAQRILQTKDKLINKLKEMVEQKTNLSTSSEQEIETSGNTDDPTLLEVNLVGASSATSTNWAYVQYEEIKAENELFKQELQAREHTIHTLRRELQEAELLVQHADEQLYEQTNQLDEQLKDERSRLTLVEQDYARLKQELAYIHEDFQKQKQTHLLQLTERERELERLRLQLTAKTINHVNDDELEKRLQTLTESLIHKQTIIESLQTDKSSLTMQLERLEKRLDDYEKIASSSTNNHNSLTPSSRRLQTTAATGATTINMDMEHHSIYDNDQEENLRYRLPMLRERPYDPDIAKKVKRAANELDKLGIRLGIFLKRYPAVRLGVIFYAILLHLWTLIVLFTYTPEVHGNMHSIDMPHKP